VSEDGLPGGSGSGGGAVAVAGDVLEAARSMRDEIRALAPQIEADRQLPPELVQRMRDAGLFQVFLPRSLGGPEIDPVTANRVVEEVSYADGSAGWCVMIAGQTAGFAGYMPEEYAREVWGGGAIACGTARPIGRAVPTSMPEEGFVVSGRWPFASGSSHADWFLGECVIYDEGEPRRDAEGNTLSQAILVPREAVTIHDTWDTLGLRGTASHDFSIDEAFVPAGRGFLTLTAAPQHPWPLYQAPGLVFVSHGAQALGVARAALETALEIAGSKVGWGGVPLREVPSLQGVIAEATVLVESARAYMYQVAGELWQAVQAGEDTSRLRPRVRLATSHAATSSIRAVDLVHGALATSTIFRKSALERHFRDIHTAAAHVMVGPLTYQAAGRAELGMEPNFPFF
jgi:indole-3-acetate monooxygenase